NLCSVVCNTDGAGAMSGWRVRWVPGAERDRMHLSRSLMSLSLSAPCFCLQPLNTMVGTLAVTGSSVTGESSPFGVITLVLLLLVGAVGFWLLRSSHTRALAAVQKALADSEAQRRTMLMPEVLEQHQQQSREQIDALNQALA